MFQRLTVLGCSVVAASAPSAVLELGVFVRISQRLTVLGCGRGCGLATARAAPTS